MQLFGKFARRFYVLVLIPPSPSLPFVIPSSTQSVFLMLLNTDRSSVN